MVWARPGRASNSPRIPITGPPLLNSAMNAVGMPATPFSILKPWFSRDSANLLELFISWYPSSANSHISKATS